jgi:hypothetical protein
LYALIILLKLKILQRESITDSGFTAWRGGNNAAGTEDKENLEEQTDYRGRGGPP